MDSAHEDPRTLSEQRDFYRSIFDAATDLIIVIDTERRKVVETNQATRDRLGYSAMEIDDMPCLDLFPPDDSGLVCRHIGSHEDNGTLIKATLVGKGGTVFPVELSIEHFRLEGRSLCIAICRDITERLASERQLIEARENAERSNHLKSAFLANMSHELRTPMNAILGFSELLCEELADEPQHRMVEIINSSGHRLLETLNSILDLSLIEANRMQVIPEAVNVTEVAEEVCLLFRQLADRKGLRLEYIPPGREIHASIDPRLLRQIMNNLLGNAIKFTTQGFIELQVEQVRQNGSEHLRLRVVDTGIGISQENLSAIFEEFRQVSEGYNRRFEGSGLGLALTQKFVELLGGSVKVNSTPGEGSEFIVLLPYRPVGEACA
jgi:PAS domain S-box-containing protein